MLILLICFLAAASAASFGGLCLTRLPAGKSLVRPASFCDRCGTRLTPLQLFPVFGWIFRCRKCGNRGSVLYPLAETVSGTAAILLLLGLPSPEAGIQLFLFLFFLLLSALLDWKTGEVFPSITIAGIAAGLILAALTGKPPFAEALAGAAAGWLLFYFLRLVTGGGTGLGDADFAALCGSFLGWKLLSCGLVTGFLIGGIWGGFMLITGKKERKTAVPYTPFLAVGMITVLVSGNWLFRLYRF